MKNSSVIGKKKLVKKIETISAPWIDEQLVRLGNYSSDVVSDEAGMYYARQYNGAVIKVYNGRANAPAIFDLHVRIGRDKSSPNIWQIIKVQQDYTIPPEQGMIAPHHRQHEYNQSDMVLVDRRQVMQLNVLVYDAGSFIVTVFGSVIRTLAGPILINNANIDLSSYVPTVGAIYVNIEADSAGVLSVTAGTPFASKLSATVDDIPVPSVDNNWIAFVILYEGQTELSNLDISIPYSFFAGGDTIVSWGNITGTLADQLDLQVVFDTKSDVGHTHSEYVQLLMEDGVTFPPVPLTNDDGTDWIYDI
jgi:hypothetical protein